MLTIVRGLPGSGKSTYAKKMAAKTDAVHVESDNFFMKNGKYEFDQTKLGIAHRICFKSVQKALEQGRNVIVSNTFTMLKEINRYVKMAENLKVKVDIVSINRHLTTAEVFARNVHSVPIEVIERMQNRWVLYPGETFYSERDSDEKN